MPTSKPWELFSARMAELRDLAGAISLLSWDQETYMPARGVTARGEQLGTLMGISHERLTAAEFGDAISTLEQTSDLGAEQRAMVRAMRVDRDRAARIPVALVRELAERQSASLEAWREARERRDFGRFAPHLGKLLALKRTMADCYGVPAGGERYDALLDGHEEGMRVARLKPIFEKLRGWLVPLVQQITAKPAPTASFVARRFDSGKQWKFTLELLDALGFDMDAGRQDRSTHPFSISMDPSDVRVTTRLSDDLPFSAIFSTIHEAGHGMYEQGLPARRTAICAAPSMGIHESQSRLWENQVGRSFPFWKAFLPKLARHFPAELAGVSVDEFYAAANRVERSLIRVEADEVTYNLHILLRFELELQLLRGELEVDGLPKVWNERMEAMLGIRPAHDGEGVLQDIHWAQGEFGYFPTYTIGNLYAASLFASARKALDLDALIARGELVPLRDWLRVQVHEHGRMELAEDIVKRATGRGLDDTDFAAYLRQKYGALYHL